LHLRLHRRGHRGIDTCIINVCGSSGRRAGSIEHEDVNVADTFSRFAEQSRCTIGGQEIATVPIAFGSAAATSSARSLEPSSARSLERLVTTTLAPSSQCPGGRQAESMH
jgi:hypothetical protein